MNARTEKKGEARKRQFHRPEQRRAPHRQPPSSKEIAPSIPGRDVTESRSHKPLPTARPVRSTPRSVQGRPEASGTPGQVTPPVPVRPSRAQTSRVQFDLRMGFTLFGFAVAAVLVILFGLDLALAVPFQRVSPLMDVTYLICGIILAGLSWSCFRDLR